MNLLILSSAIAGAAFFLSESRAAKPLREWIGGPLNCGYCLAHWLAIPVFIQHDLLTTMAVAWLAAMQWAAMTTMMKISGR